MPGASLRSRCGYCRTLVLGQNPSTLVVGPNSLTIREILSGTSSLPSNAMNVPSGAIILAWAGMGVIANLAIPTDSKNNTYTPLLPPQTYQGWALSGQRLYAATGVAGDPALVVSEAMSDTQDEVTLSTLVVSGGAIISPSVSETPNPGPVTSASVTVSGPAILISSWWGDGGWVQASITPSIPAGEANSSDGAGWVKLHEFSSPGQQRSGLLQTALAIRQVSLAGTYACKWTATEVDASPGQGGVVYMLAVG